MGLAGRAAVPLRLLVRGIVHRRGIAALTVLVAIVASAAAAAGPMYRQAAAISAFRARLAGASPDASGVRVAGSSWPGDNPDKLLQNLVPRLPLSTAEIPSMQLTGELHVATPLGLTDTA